MNDGILMIKPFHCGVRVMRLVSITGCYWYTGEGGASVIWRYIMNRNGQKFVEGP